MTDHRWQPYEVEATIRVFCARGRDPGLVTDADLDALLDEFGRPSDLDRPKVRAAIEAVAGLSTGKGGPDSGETLGRMWATHERWCRRPCRLHWNSNRDYAGFSSQVEAAAVGSTTSREEYSRLIRDDLMAMAGPGSYATVRRLLGMLERLAAARGAGD